MKEYEVNSLVKKTALETATSVEERLSERLSNSIELLLEPYLKAVDNIDSEFLESKLKIILFDFMNSSVVPLFKPLGEIKIKFLEEELEYKSKLLDEINNSIFGWYLIKKKSKKLDKFTTKIAEKKDEPKIIKEDRSSGQIVEGRK
jgi:hypothetical protein